MHYRNLHFTEKETEELSSDLASCQSTERKDVQSGHRKSWSKDQASYLENEAATSTSWIILGFGIHRQSRQTKTILLLSKEVPSIYTYEDSDEEEVH